MHKSVMLHEALEWLAPRPEGWWLDATVGGGGHTEALLAATAPAGRVLGIDQDRDVLAVTRERLSGWGDRLILAQGNFRDMEAIVRQQTAGPFLGVLLDLGVSSFQLDDAARGFSFSKSGPLDMRMDRGRERTAADILNHADEKVLADLFYHLGEERRSRRLASWVVRQRPFQDTAEFARLVARVVGRTGGIHPATRAFQALRIEVNDELGALAEGLDAAARVLVSGGRLVVISFHSLEDRIVKERLRGTPWERLTKHVVRPGETETRDNPRARSARLRAAALRSKA